MSSNPHILARTAMASVTILLAGGAITPAGAFFAGFPNDGRPAAQQPSDLARPTINPPRSLRPRAPATAARPKGATVDKTAATESELAAKAKGPLAIIISLDKQQLTLYSGGEAIAHSRVSTGQRGHTTPTGVFSIIQKDRWHRSNIYDDAPMYYMQRITWSGVALHQGVVPNYPASHGCVRLPEAFARQLWSTTKMGARVIIARGEVAPVAISHPRLFAPKRVPAAPVISQAEALRAAQQAWTFAELASKTPLVGATLSDTPALGVPAEQAPRPAARVLKSGPVSVFISRREGKLFVRKGFEPVFDMPVTIANPDQPLGTHVFTAIAEGNDAMRWTVVSMEQPGASAAGALDRISIPQDALDQISELTSVGASLIISDQGLGPETGKGTDFIVLTK